MNARQDKRYTTHLWRKRRITALNHARRTCWVNGCPEPGNVADHINPVYPGMPDHEFYALSNLRASCKRHNTARGVAARLDRETRDGVAAPQRGNALVARGSFFRRRSAND